MPLESQKASTPVCSAVASLKPSSPAQCPAYADPDEPKGEFAQFRLGIVKLTETKRMRTPLSAATA